jgi:hypothetical protein
MNGKPYKKGQVVEYSFAVFCNIIEKPYDMYYFINYREHKP